MEQSPPTIGNPLELAVWSEFGAKPAASVELVLPSDEGKASLATMAGAVNRLQNFIQSRKRNNLAKAYDELPACVASQQAKFNLKKSGVDTPEDSPARTRHNDTKPSLRPVRRSPTGKPPLVPKKNHSPKNTVPKLTTVKEFNFSTRTRAKKDESLVGRGSYIEPSPRGSYSQLEPSPRGSYSHMEASPRGSQSQVFAVPLKHKKMFMQELSQLRSVDNSQSGHLSQDLGRWSRSPLSIKPSLNSPLSASSSPSSYSEREGARPRAGSFDNKPTTITAANTGRKSPTPRRPPVAPSPRSGVMPSARLSPFNQFPRPKYISASLTTPLTHAQLAAAGLSFSPSASSATSPPPNSSGTSPSAALPSASLLPAAASSFGSPPSRTIHLFSPSSSPNIVSTPASPLSAVTHITQISFSPLSTFNSNNNSDSNITTSTPTRKADKPPPPPARKRAASEQDAQLDTLPPVITPRSRAASELTPSTGGNSALDFSNIEALASIKEDRRSTSTPPLPSLLPSTPVSLHRELMPSLLPSPLATISSIASSASASSPPPPPPSSASNATAASASSPPPSPSPSTANTTSNIVSPSSDANKDESDGLPPSLVYGILQFFDVSDLASAARVCRQWAILAEADPLWRVLNERVRPKVLSKLEMLAREEAALEPFLFTPVFPQRWKDAVRDTCLYSTAKPVSEDYVALVVDTGIGSIKFGLVGADKPRIVPSALGFPLARADPSEVPPITKRDGQVVLQKFPAFLAGADLPKHRGSLRYDVHTIFNSHDVGDTDDLNTIWAYMFDSLHVDPTQHPVLSSVPLQCPLDLQASHLEMLFETFGVPAAHLELSPLLAAYGYGSATGLVLDLGASSAQILPICDGVVLQHATNKVRYLGGRTRGSLMRSLLNTGVKTDYYDSMFAREVTEKIARVSLQALAPSWDAFANQRPTMQEQSSVSLVMGEALFAPSWILDDQEMSGLPQLVAECLSKCAIDVRPRLLGNVMLCGGGAHIPGVVERLQYELEGLFPMSRQTISILHDPEPVQLAWRGGCVLAAHPAFQSSWLLKEDYDEGLSDKWAR